MSFNFKESLSKGQNSASLVRKNKNELDKIYTELTSAFSEYFGFDVNLYDRIDYKGVNSNNPITMLSLALGTGAQPERVATGYTILLLSKENMKIDNVTLFKYKEADDVYPITILFNKDKILCYNQDEFADAVKIVLENPRLNLELIDFKKKVEDIMEVNVSDDV